MTTVGSHDESLSKLVSTVKPPQIVRFPPADWKKTARALGISYPMSFRRYAETYGTSVWFDHVFPFYPSEADLLSGQFRNTLDFHISDMRGSIFTEDYVDLCPNLYPESGGWLPFMIDTWGWKYLWDTSSGSPDDWPIVVWEMGQTVFLDAVPISELLLSYIESRDPMLGVWGAPTFEEKRLRTIWQAGEDEIDLSSSP